VKEASAARTASTVRIGSSAAISAGTRGACDGASRRRTAMRVAAASCGFSWLARLPVLAAQ
jgi:hypothetical protein